MEEFMKRLADRFTAAELVELLGLETESICEMFEEKIVEAYDDLEDIMTYGR